MRCLDLSIERGMYGENVVKDKCYLAVDFGGQPTTISILDHAVPEVNDYTCNTSVGVEIVQAD